MTVSDLFNGIYLWLDSVAPAILLAGILIPLAGTALAWIGKQGNSNADGRFVAPLFIGFSLGALLLAVFAIAFAVSIMDADPLQANAALLAAPVVCTVGCVLGIGRVFPVNQLASLSHLHRHRPLPRRLRGDRMAVFQVPWLGDPLPRRHTPVARHRAAGLRGAPAAL